MSKDEQERILKELEGGKVLDPSRYPLCDDTMNFGESITYLKALLKLLADKKIVYIGEDQIKRTDGG